MDEKYNIKKMSLFILIIMAVLVAFYGITTLTLLLTEKNNNNETTESEESVIDYEKILIQNLFSKEGSYYVLVEFADDENIDDYNSYLNEYSEKENSLKVYTADMSVAFNKKYISEESNFEKDNLKFNETVFLKIEDDEISESYVGIDNIEEKLKELTSEDGEE